MGVERRSIWTLYYRVVYNLYKACAHVRAITSGITTHLGCFVCSLLCDGGNANKKCFMAVLFVAENSHHYHPTDGRLWYSCLMSDQAVDHAKQKREGEFSSSYVN